MSESPAGDFESELEQLIDDTDADDAEVAQVLFDKGNEVASGRW